MTRFYLSGPISNPDPAIVARNKQAFMDAEEAIRARFPRCTVANPVRICAGIEDGVLTGHALWLACMRLCLQEVPRCDEIVLLPGYDFSNGAGVERYNACALDMPEYELAGLLEQERKE